MIFRALQTSPNNSDFLFANSADVERLRITSTTADFSVTVDAPTFVGDLNGTINTATLATTQVNAIDNTTIATTAYVNNKIALIPAGLVFQGTWNAATNTPTLTSGTGTTGNFYIVSVAGSTNLDGITDWKVGDWAVFIEQGASDQWEKIDNSSVLDGIGTGGSVAGWSGSGTSNTLTDAPITFTSAKVEIPRNVEVITGGYPYIDLGVSSSNYFRIIHDNPSDILKIGKNGAATASSVIINPSGNIGIGAVPVGNPGTKFLAVGTAGSVAGGIQLWASSSQTHYLQFGDANSGGEVYRGGIGYNHSSETLLFLQASSTALSFTGSQAATFAGDVNTGRLFVEQSGADMIDMTRTGVGTYRFAISSSDAFSLFDVGANVDRLVIDSSGNATFGGSINGGDINLSSTNNAIIDPLSVGNILRFTDNDPTQNNNQITGTIEWETKDSNNPGIQSFITTNSTNQGKGRLVFGTGLGGSAVEKMRIDSDGNVGIGVTAPDNKLMVQGASTNGAASAGNVALFEGPSGTNGLKVFVDDTENAAGFQTISADDLLINPHGGNVGIGTASPDALLDVSSGSTSTFRLSNTDTALTEGQITGAIEFQQSDATSGGTGVSAAIKTRSSARPDSGIYYGQSADLGFFVSGSSIGSVSVALVEAMTVRAPGNVGIGTTSPTGKLDITQGAGGTAQNIINSGEVAFRFSTKVEDTSVNTVVFRQAYTIIILKTQQ